MTFRIEVFKGVEIEPYISTLSQMRIEAFAKFPYLYVGNVETDLVHTRLFLSNDQAMLVVAFEEDKVVGVRSGLPVIAQPRLMNEQGLQQFQEYGIKAQEYYLCSEIIVSPAFQRKGIASQLMTKFIEEVKGMKFPGMIAITSIRPDDHPLRPQNYLDTGSILLTKFGFEKSSLVFKEQWPTQQPNGNVKKTLNELACWIKEMDKNHD